MNLYASTLLIIGWCLNAANPYLTERRERRKAIANALSDLLEIHHRLVVLETAVTTILNAVPLPVGMPPELQPQVEVFLRTNLASLFPDSQELGRRYNDSVSLVASSDPLLGFKLRSKDVAQPMLATLHNIAAQAQSTEATAFLTQLNPILFKEVDRALSTMILELARRRGWLTHRKVKELLASTKDAPKAGPAIIDLVKKQVEKHPPPPVQSPPTPKPPTGQGTSAEQ